MPSSPLIQLLLKAMSSPLWSSPRMTQGLGILDGILNEIASAFSKPRNDGILEFSMMSSPDQVGG